MQKVFVKSYFFFLFFFLTNVHLIWWVDTNIHVGVGDWTPLCYAFKKIKIYGINIFFKLKFYCINVKTDDDHIDIPDVQQVIRTAFIKGC